MRRPRVVEVVDPRVADAAVAVTLHAAIGAAVHVDRVEVEVRQGDCLHVAGGRCADLDVVEHERPVRAVACPGADHAVDDRIVDRDAGRGRGVGAVTDPDPQRSVDGHVGDDDTAAGDRQRTGIGGQRAARAGVGCIGEGAWWWWRGAR